VESGNTRQPLAERGDERRGGWDLGVVISAAYDDNVFLSRNNAESDIVARVTPLIAFSKGDDKGGGGSWVKAAYRPSAVVYQEHSSENRIDQNLVIEAGWQGKATRIAYTGAFRMLGDATADAGRPVDRVQADNEIRIAWTPKEKLSLEIAGANNRVDYDDPLYFDTVETYGEAALRYVYSPKTELGIAARVSRYKVDGAGPQDARSLAGMIAWMPREKIRLAMRAGLENRHSDNGSSWNPVLDGRIDWTPRRGTAFHLTGYMRQEASSFLSGQNYQANGFTAGASQRLGGHWTAVLDGGYERNNYEVVSGSGSSGRRDSIWFLRPALVRRIGDDSELSLFYQISDNSSTDSNFGYDQQLIGVEFNHKF
jgi:hypothetical protein